MVPESCWFLLVIASSRLDVPKSPSLILPEISLKIFAPDNNEESIQISSFSLEFSGRTFDISMNESVLMQIDQTFDNLLGEFLRQRFGQCSIVLNLLSHWSTGHVLHEDLQILIGSCCTVIGNNTFVIQLFIDIDFTFENLHFLKEHNQRLINLRCSLYRWRTREVSEFKPRIGICLIASSLPVSTS